MYAMIGVTESDKAVKDILRSVYGVADETQGAFVRDGMTVVELVRLHELLRENRSRAVLEIGMAKGTSSVVICHALQMNGVGTLTSIDPFQTAPLPGGYSGQGVDSLEKAGFLHMHCLIEKPDYLALPMILEEGDKFDLIVIDGWHSFDYTLLDIFYADLLLNDLGVMVIHDSSLPPVYEAASFLERKKPYQRLSAPMMVKLDHFLSRAIRKAKIALSGPSGVARTRSRKIEWRTLVAYRKLETRQVPQDSGS